MSIYAFSMPKAFVLHEHPKDTPMFISGPVLTNASLDQLDDCVRRGGYNAVKLVTAWGTPGGWTTENIHRATHMVPNIIVRTLSGDPSANKVGSHDLDFVDPNRTESEIRPWYTARPDIFIELGNEPTEMQDTRDEQIHRWTYTLNETINRCKAKFPAAKLIAPAVRVDGPNAERFLDIGARVMARCDFQGIHCYEHFGFKDKTYPAYTRQYEIARAWHKTYFSNAKAIITEYGINDPATSPSSKGTRYIDFQETLDEKIVGAMYYHLDTSAAPLQPQYVIYPKGDVATHAIRYMATSR
jgi:hypothetical protein